MDFQGQLYKNLSIDDIALKIGIVLNKRYRIDEYVSFGNMSIMYMGHDIKTDEKVLIKELAPVSMVNRDLDGRSLVPRNKLCEDNLRKLKESFDNEINVVKKLSKSEYMLAGRIPEYKDSFDENGVDYLVISYFEGKDLQKRIANKEVISFSKIAYELVDIVEKIHKAGVIHRDIKFSNIFIKDDGKVVLIDFGSSCDIDNEREILRYVSSGFSPPELYDATESTRWVDNFSIGAVMYQMLTGTKPIEYAPDGNMSIRDICEYVNIPWQLALAVMKLLELSPEKRLKKLWILKMLLK